MGAAVMVKLAFDDDWTATVTGDPLDIAPRFDFRDFRVRIAAYADVKERDQFQLGAFGSQDWLWDAPDELWFDPAGREPVGAEIRLPSSVADAADAARVPAAPPVRASGLRADRVRD